MELRIFTEPQQGASYDQLLAVARVAEEQRFGAFIRSDHYQVMGGGSGLPGPTDAWITLAGLARDTSRIRLGTLVNSATFRLPGPLAITVAQVDQMSGGRVELGLGAGWYQAEHTSYGIPFPPLGERFDRLEEQLAIVQGLWAAGEGGFSFEGTHYQLQGSPALPKPAQRPGPPIIIGGGGPSRTPKLAARFASEFNVPFRDLGFVMQQYARVRSACEAIGRAPSTLTWSAALVACCGRTEADIERRAAKIGREVADLREHGACGTPVQLVEQLQQWAAAGVERMYLQVLDIDDLDHVRLLGTEVLPHV